MSSNTSERTSVDDVRGLRQVHGLAAEGHGQADCEPCPNTRLALHLNRATVRDHKPTRDRKTEAYSGTTLNTAGSSKRFKDSLKIARFDSNTRICDSDRSELVGGVHCNGDGASIRRVLDGIA